MAVGGRLGFHVIDYVVLGLFLLVSLAIGLYYGVRGRKRQTTEEYLVGGRKMSVMPVALSLVATFESSIFMLGFPAEVYHFGITWTICALSRSTALLFSAYAYVPMIHALKITSSYEYLELRFRKQYVRVLGSCIQILHSVIYMGIVLYGPTLVLEGLFGIPAYASVLSVGIIAIAYTSLGGMKAVVFTDFFQCAVMLIGMLVVVIKGSLDVGGSSEVFRRANDNGRLSLDFSFDPRVRLSFWVALFGNTFRASGLIFQQSSVQRIASLPSAGAAKLCVLICVPCFALLNLLACAEGLVGYAYYDYNQCDPLQSGKIKNPNQIIIILAVHLFNKIPGFSGLFVAALLGASLSTLSSCLSSIPANLWEDILKRHVGKIAEWKATLIARMTAIVSGVMGIGVCFAISTTGGTLTTVALLILSLGIGPLSGLFLLSVLFPFANAKGVTIGTVIAAIMCSWMSLGKAFSPNVPSYSRLPPAPVTNCGLSNVTTEVVYSTTDHAVSSQIVDAKSSDLGIDVLYTLSPFLYAPLTILLTIIMGSIASFILRSKDEEPVDSAYIAPFIQPLWRHTKYMKTDNYEIKLKTEKESML